MFAVLDNINLNNAVYKTGIVRLRVILEIFGIFITSKSNINLCCDSQFCLLTKYYTMWLSSH